MLRQLFILIGIYRFASVVHLSACQMTTNIPYSPTADSENRRTLRLLLLAHFCSAGVEAALPAPSARLIFNSSGD